VTLAGKNTLVIGGGGDGIGREITRAFAAAGSAVAVADVDPQRADDAAAEVAAAGARSAAFVGDVGSREDVEGFVTGAALELGGLDILVTVVGGQLAFVPSAPLHEVSDEDWDLMFELNLRYVARAVRAALRVFLAQGRGGTIVSVGSITGQAGSPMQAAYGAAKAGFGEPGKVRGGRVQPRRRPHEPSQLRSDRDRRLPRRPNRGDGLDPDGSCGRVARGRGRGRVPRVAAVVVR